MLKNPRKNKHYDADEDDERFRPLKIQKLMMTMKLVDDPPPPPPTIQEESKVRVRMRMEEEETDDAPPTKKLRKVLMNTEKEEETMETRKSSSSSSSSRAWGDLPPEVLELIVKRLKQIDYGSFLCVCKSWEKLKPDVVIQLELGDTVSNIPIRYKRCYSSTL